MNEISLEITLFLFTVGAAVVFGVWQLKRVKKNKQDSKH